MQDRYEKAKKAYDDAVINVGILLFNLDKDLKQYKEQEQAAYQALDLLKVNQLKFDNIEPIKNQRKILFNINQTAETFAQQVQVSNNAEDNLNLAKAAENYEQAAAALNKAMNIVEPGFMKRAGIGIGALAAVIIVGIILTAIPATSPFGIAMIVGGLVGGAIAVGVARNQIAEVISGELASHAERIEGLKKLEADFSNIAQPKQLSEGKISTASSNIGAKSAEVLQKAASGKEEPAVGTTPKTTSTNSPNPTN
jgi:hypothetical protein